MSGVNGSGGLTSLQPPCPPQDNAASSKVGALILGLVFLVGVPGNFFVIWSVLVRARKRSVTTLLILNLACADGSLMALTPFFIVYLYKNTWAFGNVLCKVLFYLCLANMYASIQLIMLMSVHRLVAVVWPQRLGAITGRKTVLQVLVVVWLLVLTASVPAIVFREAVPKCHNRSVCESVHYQDNHVILQYTMELVLGFVVPYPVIVGSYIGILRRIRQTKFQRRIRSEKLILAIVVTFCVFWLPYHIINLVKVASALCPTHPIRDRLIAIAHRFRPITSALAFISSCANPVLYTLVGKSYIRRDGLSFMARLFEGTALDSGLRKSRQNSQQNSREKYKDADGVMLKERDPDSSASANTSSSLKITVKNGK